MEKRCQSPDLSAQMRFQQNWYDTHEEHDAQPGGYRTLVQEKHFGILMGLIDRPQGLCLDFGSGDGLYARRMTELVGPDRVICVDISRRRLLKLRAEAPTMKAVLADVHYLPFRDDTFETVYGFAILHHVGDIRGALIEAVRVVNEGGQVAFGEENNALCPLHYILTRIYGNWEVEKGTVQIRARRIATLMGDVGLTSVRWRISGMTIAGMGPILFGLTWALEHLLERFRPLTEFAAFLYISSRKASKAKQIAELEYPFESG